MYCWVILRNRGPDCSDWSLRSGLILGRVFNSLFKLFTRHIFIICVFNELLELSFGLLSGLDGIDDMHGLSRRILLRNNWPNRSDWKLLYGIIFHCFRN